MSDEEMDLKPTPIRTLDAHQVRAWSPNAKTAQTKTFVRWRAAQRHAQKMVERGYVVEVWACAQPAIVRLSDQLQPTDEAAEACQSRYRQAP